MKNWQSLQVPEKLPTFAVPPAWIQKPEKEVDVIAGNALHIPCLASGSPKPNIAWKREVG